MPWKITSAPKRGVDVAVEVLEISVLAREADPKGGKGKVFFTWRKSQELGEFRLYTGWWFQIFSIFTPTWGRFPC